MSKSTLKVKTVRGEPVIELRPLSDPAAWHGILTYAEMHEQIEDEVYDSLAEWLYENPTDRARVKKLKRWNPVLKEITQLRQRYLKDLIENSDWVKKQREEDPKWGSILKPEYSEELDCKELEKITVKLETIVKLLQNKE
jgi:hypothetical protein